jgi:hypothetical protein
MRFIWFYSGESDWKSKTGIQRTPRMELAARMPLSLARWKRASTTVEAAILAASDADSSRVFPEHMFSDPAGSQP